MRNILQNRLLRSFRAYKSGAFPHPRLAPGVIHIWLLQSIARLFQLRLAMEVIHLPGIEIFYTNNHNPKDSTRFF